MPKHKEIFYSIEGEGPVVLLLHGFCETHLVWSAISKELSKTHRVIAIDIPGFGQSDLPANSFSLDSVARLILDFMTYLKVEKFSLVGHSMGGYITLSMAAQSPRLLNSICLFHSTALSDTDEKKISRNKVIEFVKQHGVAQFIASFIPPLFSDKTIPEVAELVDQASGTPLETVVKYTAAMRDRQEHLDTLSTFPSPVLFIAGEKDPGITVESLREQAKLSPRSTFAIVEGAAHMGMLEKPVETGQILKKFLFMDQSGV